jgi:hypothetical protein
MIVDNKRPVRISNFEIGEISAVLGCDRLCSSVGRLLGPGRGGNRPPSDLRQSPLRAGCDLRLLSQLPLADPPRVHHMRTLIQIPPARLAPSLASPFLLQRGNNKWLSPFLLGLQEERRLAAVSSRHHMVEAPPALLTPQVPRHPNERAPARAP